MLVGFVIVAGFFWGAAVLVAVLYVWSGRAHGREVAELTASARELRTHPESFSPDEAQRASDLLRGIAELPYRVVLETPELRRLWEARQEVGELVRQASPKVERSGDRVHLPEPVQSADRRPLDSAFLKEREAFNRLKPELLREHRGKYVAVHQGEVVEIGENTTEVAREVYRKLGHVPLYIGLVAEDLPVVHIPSPRLTEATE